MRVWSCIGLSSGDSKRCGAIYNNKSARKRDGTRTINHDSTFFFFYLFIFFMQSQGPMKRDKSPPRGKTNVPPKRRRIYILVADLTKCDQKSNDDRLVNYLLPRVQPHHLELVQTAYFHNRC